MQQVSSVKTNSIHLEVALAALSFLAHPLGIRLKNALSCKNLQLRNLSLRYFYFLSQTECSVFELYRVSQKIVRSFYSILKNNGMLNGHLVR